MTVRGACSWARCLILPIVVAAVTSRAEEYEIGGPLAGVRLPRFAVQHGEQPGYPGCIPELIASGEALQDMGQEYRQWGPQGQAPEWQLYDGSVEHWRAYMFKYMPIRSFFDRQSQLKNFVAPEIPGAAASHADQYAAPVYWVPRHAQPQPTGRVDKPVPVVRMAIDNPVLKLDLGELDPGVYVVRAIGAVETARLRPFHEPLFVRMAVNDGPDGQVSRYRLRVGYCDEFYSVAEFYFHAAARRRYRAELAVDRGSTVDLLVHNISLDDVLAGTLRRAIKTRTTIASAEPAAAAARAEAPRQGRAVPEPLTDSQRLQRDAAIWNGFPPVNAQGSNLRAQRSGYGAIPGVRTGSDRLTAEQIVQRHGAWLPPEKAGKAGKAKTAGGDAALLVNPKLGLVYTVDDLFHHRPLPDPYPLKDDGAGLYFPDPDDPNTGAAWTPVGNRVHEVRRQYYVNVGRSLDRYKQTGNRDDAHDAALRLVRFAYDFPTLDFSEYLSNTVHDPGPFNRDGSCRRRFSAANFLPHYPLYVKPIMFQYDELYEFIRSNQRLARSVGRFVPWVKTPEDVIRLIDVYLVQTTAKRIMRYHYHTDVVDIANLAAVVGDRAVTDPWLRWLFSRTFIYPLPVAGVQDVMISGCTREGTEVVGSTYYAQGEGASRVAASLDLYLKTGGSAAFDLSDAARFPKPVAHCYWRLENVVAGGDFLRIGDVCGPDKVPGHTLRDLRFAAHGWRWTHDPKFAFILRHYVGRGDQSDTEWSRIEKAAGRQTRAPWLENRSRVLPMWAGVLESGLQHDDPRFRRAAYLRLGYGMGHHHYDTLDLQVVAHGLPMTVDAGQRPGYSVPGDRTTRVHNLVQVDGHPAYRHAWATALADCVGTRYLAANATPPSGIDLFRRQIALVDVDEGRGSQKLSPESQQPGAVLPAGVITANSYVFDVFRAAGGRQHTYCFHGPLNDAFTWNAEHVQPPAAGSDEAEYLDRFRLMPEGNLAGDAPAQLEATWRMSREIAGPGAGEKEMARKNFDPDGPRKFTRLHLFDVAGARALRGELVCRQWNYHFTNLMVQTNVDSPSSGRAFSAVIEPFAGEPFITDCRPLDVSDHQRDARQAVAVEVTTRNGHTDVCFADGRPERIRKVPDAQLIACGEFAFYSIDRAGLRQATLVGGRILETPRIRIAAEAAERRAHVTRVDYAARKMWIDALWPARSSPSVFEVGVPGHWTTFTARSCETTDAGTALALQRGADYFRSRIERIEPADRVITTRLRPLVEHLDHNRAGWVASDEACRTFWRATYLGAGRFRLDGSRPVDHEAFGQSGVLRLWECGVGDQLRQSTWVSVRRLEGGVLEVTGDVPVTIELPAKTLYVSSDAKSWERVADAGTGAKSWARLALPPRQQPRYVKAEGS